MGIFFLNTDSPATSLALQGTAGKFNGGMPGNGQQVKTNYQDFSLTSICANFY